jgi:uncharacterized protein (TIGR02246 family)
MAGLDLQLLADRLALRQLVDDYARAVDQPDGESAAALFVPDGVLCIFERGTAEPVRERKGRDEIAAAMNGLTRYDTTLHFVGNHYAAIDGDIATGETYCLAHHIREVEGEGSMDFVMAIRYLDAYRRVDEGWCIARRELRVEFTEDRPVTGP